jgi:UTP--glucose-1-phosphate uridylyltransferase
MGKKEVESMSVDFAVVPVAGQGTRMLPATKSQPKEMLPVGRKPVVQYVVEELAQAGIRRLLFITGPGKASIENHFDINGELITFLRETGKEDLLVELEFERRGLEYFYTRQRRTLGLGHAILCARPVVGTQPFVAALGDTIIGLHAQSTIVARMIETFEKERADAVIAFAEVPAEDVVHYGIAKAQGTPREIFALTDVVEKPARADAPSNLAIAARYVFRADIFGLIEKTEPGKGGEIQLTDAIRAQIRQGGKVLGMRLAPGERRFDIGNFETYFQAFCEFALADPRHGDELRVHLKRLLNS